MHRKTLHPSLKKRTSNFYSSKNVFSLLGKNNPLKGYDNGYYRFGLPDGFSAFFSHPDMRTLH
jgi:hypothetical protein